MLGFNYVDVFIIIALIAYVLMHISEGFFDLTRRLVAFIGATMLAFLTYGYFAEWLTARLSYPRGILDAGSFILLFILFNTLLNTVLRKLVTYIPARIQFSKLSQAFAAIPALIDGLILASLVLFLLVITPILPQVKAPIENSRIGTALVNSASSWEVELDKIFGKATQETLGFLTVHPSEDETVSLPFHPTQRFVDKEAEQKMLVLVNIEREKAGVRPLVWKESLAEVGRAHADDMWERSYFAHVNPDGLTPFDRMKRAGITFRTAGENLALARTVERAHEGLMNSPGHKRNILDPAFGHVGMGVVDGGIYGQMFTQEFTD